jgi:uncharacterized protein (TIRG00374 family)
VTAAGFAVSALFLAVAVRRLNWEEVSKALRGATLLPWLPAAIACYLVGQVVRGVRCRLLLKRDAHLSLTTATNVVVVGYAVNNILPARAGELARSAMVSERTGLPYAQSLTLILVERILDGLAILLLFFVGAELTSFRAGWLRGALWVSLLAFGAAAVIVAAAVAWPSVPMTVTSRLTARLSPRLHQLAVRLMASFTAGVTAVGDVRNALRLFGLSLLVWTLEAGMFLLLLPALGLPFEPAWAVIGMAVTNLGLMVPSSPGFIGPFHWFCMQTLVALGAAAPTAFAYAVLVHAAFYVPVTLWGVLALLRYGVELAQLKSITRAVRNLPETEPSGTPMRVVASLPASAPPGPLPVARLLESVIDAFLPWQEGVLAGMPESDERVVVGRVATFVNGEVRALPRRLQLAFSAGLMAFAAWARLSNPRGFRAQTRARRATLVDSWAFGGWPTGRKLFRLIRSTSLIAFYDHPLVASRLDPPELVGTRALGIRDR